METAGKGKKINYKRGIFILAMIIVPLINFLLFYLYVNIDSILLAFRQEKGGELFFTWDNFKMMFQEFSGGINSDKSILLALKNTMVFFSTSLLVILPLTVFVAYFIYKKIPGYKFFRVVFFLPSIISSVVLTMLFANIVGVNGPVASLMQKILGLERVPELLGQDEYALGTIVVYCIWTGFGTNLILLNGAMARIPRRGAGGGETRRCWTSAGTVSNYFAVDMANVDDADHVYVYRDFYGERPHSAFYGRRA